ncbi:methyltransferase [Myxococcus sp. MxC21-1]|uniref:methyltransferase n=1 Tax=Myxococcus sp. MxC21-1 TaxID=3041439 RepID=UPI00292E96C4|nr:methyltransferase [Myxococcus sp. MxC21-1]WNZ63009.1 methyltransferase [Myxococcus sp. MxC21-1]
MLDVGGGDGTLAAHGERAPGPSRGRVQPARHRATGGPHPRALWTLPERLGFQGGDFLREPLPGGYDTLCFVRVLHDWPADTARALLVAARDALPPGGRVLICEEFRTPERLAAQFFWSYFLMGVDTCVSRLREVEHYLRVLDETGFKDAEVLPGPFELILAHR